MTQIITWCIARLPFHPRSRRAIDETLADWTHEQREAATTARRLVTSILGALSIVRVVSLSLVREAVDVSWTRGLAARGGVLAALVALLAFATVLPMVDAVGSDALTLFALGTPMALLVILPPAIFLMFAWRPVSSVMPTAGTAVFLALVTLALAGWLVPLSSDLINAALRQSMDTLEGVENEASHLTTSQIALAVTGWAVLAGATAICAAMVGSRSPLRSHWWLAAVPMMYAALIPVFTLTIGYSFIVFRTVGDPPEGFRPGIAAWTTATALMIVAMTYRRRDTPSGLASSTLQSTPRM